MSANQKAIAFGRTDVAIASPMLIKNNICQTKRDRLRTQKRFLIPFLKNNDCLEFPVCLGWGASLSAPTKMPLLSLADY
jgi:hypothetical protein